MPEIVMNQSSFCTGKKRFRVVAKHYNSLEEIQHYILDGYITYEEKNYEHYKRNTRKFLKKMLRVILSIGLSNLIMRKIYWLRFVAYTSANRHYLMEQNLRHRTEYKYMSDDCCSYLFFMWYNTIDEFVCWL